MKTRKEQPTPTVKSPKPTEATDGVAHVMARDSVLDNLANNARKQTRGRRKEPQLTVEQYLEMSRQELRESMIEHISGETYAKSPYEKRELKKVKKAHFAMLRDAGVDRKKHMNIPPERARS